MLASELGGSSRSVSLSCGCTYAKVREGVSEQDGVSEQGAAFRLHAVEQLRFQYAVSTRVNV